jgi:creatinine amidohydrolase
MFLEPLYTFCTNVPVISLAEAVVKIEPVNGVRVIAFTDLEGLVAAAYRSSRAFGIDPAKSGAHSGEWETSLMLALRPEQVKMDRAVEGFVGELSEIMSKVFDGIQNLDQNGVLGDPRPATAEAGNEYLDDIIEFLYQWASTTE